MQAELQDRYKTLTQQGSKELWVPVSADSMERCMSAYGQMQEGEPFQRIWGYNYGGVEDKCMLPLAEAIYFSLGDDSAREQAKEKEEAIYKTIEELEDAIYDGRPVGELVNELTSELEDSGICGKVVATQIARDLIDIAKNAKKEVVGVGDEEVSLDR